MDNKAVEGAFAKKMAKKWQTQSLIRKIVIWAASSLTYFYVQYINTKDNFLADPLSRLDLSTFALHAFCCNIHLDPDPTPFKLCLWDSADKF